MWWRIVLDLVVLTIISLIVQYGQHHQWRIRWLWLMVVLWAAVVAWLIHDIVVVW